MKEDQYFYPDMETVKTYKLCTKIIPFNTKIKGFSEIKGSLQYKSRNVNLHFMVIYGYDSNEILAEPTKNRQAATTSNYFTKLRRF